MKTGISFSQIQFSVKYTKLWRVKRYRENIRYKSIFCYSYSTDSPLLKCVCIFLRNKYFLKYRWFKGKMMYFNAIVLVSKNKKFLAICTYAYLGLKKLEAECRDSNDHVLCNDVLFVAKTSRPCTFSVFKLQLP